MSPADPIIRRLDAARQKWWLFTLLSTTAAGVCVSLALMLVFLLGDAYVQFSQPMLAVMLAIWLTVTVALVVLTVRRLTRNQRGLEATARRVEAEFPELGSNLINAVQLSEDTDPDGKAFRAAAINQAVAEIGHVRFDRAAAKESRWRRFRHCMQTPRDLVESSAVLGLLIAVAVVCQMLIPNLGSAANRLMTPWKFVASVGEVKLEVAPGNTQVMLGESVHVVATVLNPAAEPRKATIFITHEGQEEIALPMAAGEKVATEIEQDGETRKEPRRRYKFSISSIIKPLRYRVEIGDSQTERFQVEVCEKPTIENVEVTYRYPPYMHREPETFAQATAALEAPQYTVADLHVRTSGAVTAGYAQMQQFRFTGEVRQGGRLLVIEDMHLLDDGTFTIHINSSADHTDPDPRVNRIHVLPDRPPSVQLRKPARQSTSLPGAELPVVIHAADANGLGRVWLETKVVDTATQDDPSEEAGSDADRSAPTATADTPEWTEFEDDTATTINHSLPLDQQRIAAGQTVLIRALARDRASYSDFGRDLSPQVTATPWHRVRLVAAEEHSADALQQIDALRTSLWKILEKQLRGRVFAGEIVRRQQLAEQTALAGEVRVQQVAVQKDSITLVKSIGPDDCRPRQDVKRALSGLAFGEMLEAVGKCDALAKIDTVEGFDGKVPELTASQDRIIAALRKLLDVARVAQSDVLAEMQNRPGGDLPEEAQQAAKDLAERLDQAMEQQKKVVEAAENLAKATVEDFSEKKQQLLEALAAAEDDWSKFMTELNTDLSKLPEQDFANPSLLKELVEIQTEIKMAEDALLKKTADIAVPLEQLGAEMAEEIKTNLEKWLPDTPDRENWSQEESLSDQDKEAPMAELPGELEDLIGELMEEEEDLFDEMEDASSSAADSLDKGAGWDAADGPISNMSAKGVTGNRLPNTSEIGGRSGEGRSGKSSGEFVGDEAIGKGGRKTPSRLTPDPYVKGQIRDHSRDPSGGATGGGKESGQGGEGLEGPSPGAKDRNLQRLAGKQAALRNKAEGIDLQFEVSSFHHTDLQKMIEMMAQIERDLNSGRYQSALRQQKVLLDGLGSAKQHAGGQFEVRQDDTANLPTDVQKQIFGSMDDPSPTGWEELNRKYFERLNKAATGGRAP